MALMCTTRFERYNRGDLVAPRHEERFRGTYPHSVVEVTEADAAALAEAGKTGTVGQWIAAMCERPSLAEQERAAAAEATAQAQAEQPDAAPTQARGRRGRKAAEKPAEEPEPEPIEGAPAADIAEQDGEG